MGLTKGKSAPLRSQQRTKSTITKASSYGETNHISAPGFNYYSTQRPGSSRTTITTNHGMNAHTERFVSNSHGYYHTTSNTIGSKSGYY